MLRRAFLGQARLVSLGQYSWNQFAQPFQSMPAGGGVPTGSYGPVEGSPQRVSPAPEAPAMPTPGRTYDCTNGSDFKLGVDAATAAKLKAQGYVCTPSASPEGAAPIPEFPTTSEGGMTLPGDFSGMMGRRPSMGSRLPTVPIGRYY